MAKPPRAFKLPDPPESEIIITKQVLFHIKDIAHKLIQEDFGPQDTMLHRILYQALHDYMVQRGARPNFVVKLHE